ncbi:alpha/beta fold hydrolase [Mycobacterium sp.]|uniref:alpha/beta fold hydrolase n=1 Tax=Mycobacterium sp. TaxID=1785 RepID=UPI002BCF8EF5|nr:alpha/beta fold hydrolase [Mycobacterium sp.]HKP44443.1 alpha/beta fold hydrolase [Mycobacterium sp.]
MAQRYRVIAPATYDAEVDRIDRLADALGLDRFNLVAHDYGGFLGLGYALRRPRPGDAPGPAEYACTQHLSAVVLPLLVGPAVGRDPCARRRMPRLDGHPTRSQHVRRVLHALSPARPA